MKNIFIASLAVLTFSSAALAQNGTWTNAATGGVWSNSTNWSGGVIASGSDAVADFSTLNITANNSLTLGANQTVGTIITGDTTPSNTWTIANTAGLALTLAGTSPTITTNSNTTITVALAGTSGFTKNGSAALVLNGTGNTISGAIILNGGNLSAQSTTNSTAGALSQASSFALNNGTLIVSNASGNVLGSGIISFNGGALQYNTASASDYSPNFSTAAGQLYRINVSGTNNVVTYGTGLTSAGGSLTKGGNATGTLVLSGSSTYTGATTLNVGTLRANVTSIDDVSGAFGVHSAVTAAAATTLDINSNDTQIGSLAGAGSVTLGSAHLKLGSDNTSTSFSGVMSGTGPLTKQGTGTQTFTGVNTYSGATTISAGTLKLDTTGSIANSTIIVVADGATLDVSTKTGGFSLVGRDLTLDVGASGSKGFIDAGATAGALTYGGNLTLNVTTATPSSSYQLFNVNAATGSLSALTLAGSFTGSLTNNSGVWTATIGGQDWSFDQLTGYLSVVTVVPEPSTYAALLGLAALGFTAMRRRRNSTLIR